MLLVEVEVVLLLVVQVREDQVDLVEEEKVVEMLDHLIPL